MPEHYLHDLYGDNKECMLLIGSLGFVDGIAIIGLPGFQGYYTLHDMEDYSMSWGPMKGSNSPPLTYDQIPTKPISQAGKPSTLIYWGVLSLYAGGCYLLFSKVIEPDHMKDRWRKNNSAQTEADKVYYNSAMWGYILACIALW